MPLKVRHPHQNHRTILLSQSPKCCRRLHLHLDEFSPGSHCRRRSSPLDYVALVAPPSMPSPLLASPHRILTGAPFFVPGASLSRCHHLLLQLRLPPPSPISPPVHPLASPCGSPHVPCLPFSISSFSSSIHRRGASPSPPFVSITGHHRVVATLRLHRRSPSRCRSCQPSATLSVPSRSLCRRRADTHLLFLRATPSRHCRRAPMPSLPPPSPPPPLAAALAAPPLPKPSPHLGASVFLTPPSAVIIVHQSSVATSPDFLSVVCHSLSLTCGSPSSVSPFLLPLTSTSVPNVSQLCFSHSLTSGPHLSFVVITHKI